MFLFVTLSANIIKNYQTILLGKGFERSVYWNEYKTKSENKIQQINIYIFSNIHGISLISLYPFIHPISFNGETIEKTTDIFSL